MIAQHTDRSGIVFDIQRASLHDGPGLRTTVFLKGCPLRCAWCHNPESQQLAPQVGLSGRVYGRSMTVREVMEPVLADQAFYESSGGGLTISGGEPTVQFEFCRDLLATAKAAGIHTCLDTCGHFPPEYLPQLLPLVGLFHFDCKLSAPAAHREWTGVDGERIRANLDWLIEHEARIILRCPVVPGVNDDAAHLNCLREWQQHPGIEAVERLPYHAVGDAKYRDLGLPLPAF